MSAEDGPGVDDGEVREPLAVAWTEVDVVVVRAGERVAKRGHEEPLCDDAPDVPRQLLLARQVANEARRDDVWVDELRDA